MTICGARQKGIVPIRATETPQQLSTPTRRPLPSARRVDGLLLDVRETADLLGVSESWVRRHTTELPVVRVGRLIKFDRPSLHRQFQVKPSAGNRMEQKGDASMFQAAKTRYQTGRVYKKGKKVVKWYGQFREDQIGADGKLFRVQKNICLGSLSELPTKQAAMRELARRMGTGTPVKADMLFRDLVFRWRAAVVPTLRTSTASYYVKMLAAHVVPAFGQREVRSISRYDVELFLAEKARAAYCRASIRGMRVSLGRVLSWAVAGAWLEKNPCAGVQLPQAPTKVRRTILKPEQVIGLASKLEEPYATLVLFLAATGLRISEAVGVQKSDFEGKVLKLRRRFFQSDSGGDLGDLKTKKSARDLPLPAWLADRVKSLAEGDGFCFCSQAGTPMNQKNALRRYVHPACAALGFRIGGWHDFRHTLTTWALKAYPTKVVSEMLGHASVKTTLDIYAHVLQEDFEQPIAEMAGKLFHDVAQNAGTQVAA
jgi:integrase